MKLYPYKQGSKGAKALADALGIKQLKHEGKRIQVKGTLINWGASRFTRDVEVIGDIINRPFAVANAANKLESFKAFSKVGVSCPDWTVDIMDAAEMLKLGHDVVIRHKLNGHSGDGIEIVTTAEGHGGLVDAPLYTQYVKKKEEYRIHVFQGEAFFVQRKARKMDVPKEEVNWKVRNLAGGFIFAHKDVEVDDAARVQACAAVASLSLDFGAVDIMLGTDGKFYVLEVNTACGLEGETLLKYVEKFQQFQ